MKKNFLFLLALILLPISAEAKTLNVVASFSILGDLVKQIGGDAVAVKSLVGPDADAHSFEPTPEDAKAIAVADVVVLNGLHFEGWLPRIIESTGSKAIKVIASEGVKTREIENTEHQHGNHSHHHEDGETDAHAWQNVSNVRLYVKNIEKILIAHAPEHAKDISARAKAYDDQLAVLDEEIKKSFAPVKKENRKILTSHDAFGYFGEAYGIEFLSPQGVSTEAEAKPADIAKLIGQIKKEGIKFYFIENMSSSRLIEQIAKDTGAKKGGRLYADALSALGGPAASYIDMMRHNTRLLVEAMK